jgi:hypothetical protein
VAPGVAASAQVEATPEAAASFRTFVANAKVSGVFQGPPTRAMINGRLTRAGEVVDLPSASLSTAWIHNVAN